MRNIKKKDFKFLAPNSTSNKYFSKKHVLRFGGQNPRFCPKETSAREFKLVLRDGQSFDQGLGFCPEEISSRNVSVVSRDSQLSSRDAQWISRDGLCTSRDDQG